MPSSSRTAEPAATGTGTGTPTPGATLPQRDIKAPATRGSYWARLPVVLRRTLLLVGIVALWQAYATLSDVSRSSSRRRWTSPGRSSRAGRAAIWRARRSSR